MKTTYSHYDCTTKSELHEYWSDFYSDWNVYCGIVEFWFDGLDNKNFKRLKL